MKSYLVALLVALTAVNVHASKARLQALSQDENGSLYIEDARNIFLNPAKISRYGQRANFEWGSNTRPSTPNAEGGIVYNLNGNYLGLQLGRESNTEAKIDFINAIGAGFAFIPPQNTINLIYGGKAQSLDWGIQALYGSSQDNAEEVTAGTTNYPNKKASTFELGGGIATDIYDAYAKLDLAYSAENEVSASNTHKLDGKISLEVGGSYSTSDVDKLYGRLAFGGFDAKYSNNAFKKEAELFNILLGWAHYLNPEDNTRFYLSPAFEIYNLRLKDGNGGAEAKSENMRIPLTIGLESTLTNWLTVRTSVTQKVLFDQTKTTVTDSHNPNSTYVAAGVGINWKKISIDGTLKGAMTGTGELDGDTLLTNVGMTYTF